MIKMFRRSIRQVSNVVDEVVDPEAPVDNLPNVTGEHPGSIGDDINLPLLVKEVGTRKKIRIVARRQEILKELEKLDKEMLQLDILLDAVSKL